MSIKYLVSQSKTITVYLDNNSYNIAPDHPFYPRIVAAVKDENSEILYDLLTNPLAGLAEWTEDGKIKWNGKELDNVLVERIKEQSKLGLDTSPMLRFLENLMLNPSERSRQELYQFLSHKNLPITEDGCFLGYKAIRRDWKDIYSNTVDNSPGQIIEMPRENVDQNHRNHCSAGYHVGTMDYVQWYGNREGSRFVIVKVNPRDAVSVPSDHNAMKLRCCKYEVLKEIERANVLDFPVYSSDGRDKYENLKDYYGEDWEMDEMKEEDEYLNSLWNEEGKTQSEDGLSQRDEFIKSETEWYLAEWADEDILKETVRRRLVDSLDTATKIGKEVCIALMAGDNAKEIFG